MGLGCHSMSRGSRGGVMPFLEPEKVVIKFPPILGKYFILGCSVFFNRGLTCPFYKSKVTVKNGTLTNLRIKSL